jgi:hypothetical protein
LKAVQSTVARRFFYQKERERMNQSVIKSRVEEFGRHMQAGTEHLYQACCIYAQTVMEDHTATEAFCKAFPAVSKTTWDKMRLVGVNAIEPTLLLLSDRLCSKLARLPIKDQREVCAAKIKIVRPSGRVITKSVREITQDEERKVFDQDMKIKSVSEQRKALKEKAKTRPYAVEGEVLRVFRSCIISKAELVQIINQIGK